MTVHFIGAGPGAADLITVRGQRLIASSPVCLYAGALVPAELRPRTRHQCCCAASDVTVNCDVVTVWSITRGAEKSLWLSTWI